VLRESARRGRTVPRYPVVHVRASGVAVARGHGLRARQRRLSRQPHPRTPEEKLGETTAESAADMDHVLRIDRTNRYRVSRIPSNAALHRNSLIPDLNLRLLVVKRAPRSSAFCLSDFRLFQLQIATTSKTVRVCGPALSRMRYLVHVRFIDTYEATFVYLWC